MKPAWLSLLALLLIACGDPQGGSEGDMIGAPDTAPRDDTIMQGDTEPSRDVIRDEDACRVGACASICGDGIVELEEQCDDANADPGDGCEDDCTFSCEADDACDDAEVCSGEETCGEDHACVAGQALEDRTPCVLPDGQDAACAAGRCEAILSGCGDGALHWSEWCDDGNVINGDGCESDCSPTCKPESFTRARVPSTITEPFTLVIASDTQLPWGSDPSCMLPGDECVIEYAIETNRSFARAMNNLETIGAWPAAVPNSGGRAVPPATGVVINGDLTAFWHPWQVELFEQFYDPAAPNADSDVLTRPLFPGLGNHDYANNVEDCWGDDEGDWIRFGSNACAAQAIRFMRRAIGCGELSSFDPSALHSFDHGSMSYSWDVGGWHFVQLHNYPGYTIDALDVSDAFEWLREDLLDATDAGLKIALNMHDQSDHDATVLDPAFLAVIEQTNVVAVFAGHFHNVSRFYDHVPNTRVPIFLSGAAEVNRFLAVEFGEDFFTIGSVNTTDGAPQWVTTDTTPDTRWDSPALAPSMVSVSTASVLCGNAVLNVGEICDDGPGGACDDDCSGP